MGGRVVEVHARPATVEGAAAHALPLAADGQYPGIAAHVEAQAHVGTAGGGPEAAHVKGCLAGAHQHINHAGAHVAQVQHVAAAGRRPLAPAQPGKARRQANGLVHKVLHAHGGAAHGRLVAEGHERLLVIEALGEGQALGVLVVGGGVEGDGLARPKGRPHPHGGQGRRGGRQLGGQALEQAVEVGSGDDGFAPGGAHHGIDVGGQGQGGVGGRHGG